MPDKGFLDYDYQDKYIFRKDTDISLRFCGEFELDHSFH